MWSFQLFFYVKIKKYEVLSYANLFEVFDFKMLSFDPQLSLYSIIA